MRLVITLFAVTGALASLAAVSDVAGPSALAPITPIAAPMDRPYPGAIRLSVDASDLSRHVIHVHESISGIDSRTVLLYPQWLPGTHAPEGPIDRMAGLRITAHGAPVTWVRDTVNVFAFHLHPAPGIRTVDVDFEYLSPTSEEVGGMEISAANAIIEWNEVVLYPAGFYARQVPVDADLTLPTGWHFASALETSSMIEPRATFQHVDLETLLDSPVYAGLYFARFDLDANGPAPVHLNLFAERPEQLETKPTQIDAYRTLVQQAYKLFGSHHYGHYDFLYSLSNQVEKNGLEHHQSSEDGGEPDSFTEWDKNAAARDLLAHEYTHSWNGKFRRPADLWTPSYDVPMQDSLLWVYEGQTEYWGEVLAARAGLWTKPQYLEMLALTAANADSQRGRDWRPLQDTTNDEIINPRRPQSWRTWQRYEDYYREGGLVWLEVDTLIRERSEGKRSLDDFARAFFGINNGSFGTVTYTFDDIVKALNAIEPYGWAAFLRERLDSTAKSAPLDGLTRGGYKLVFNETPNDFLKTLDGQRKHETLMLSLGIELNEKEMPGAVSQVAWDSPAFRAGLREGAQILAVNGIGYTADILKDAIRSAQRVKAPIELMVKSGNVFSVIKIDYQGGLRYPHLVRTEGTAARLDDILNPRP